MKTLLLITAVSAALTATTTACDSRPGPTAGGARGVTGIVELRFGPSVARYDLRVDRKGDAFDPILTPIDSAPPETRTPRHDLFGLAFVRQTPPPDSDEPVVIPTPLGTITARLAYRPLGPWQVLDRADLSVNSPLGTGPDFTVAVLEPRLVR